MGFLEPNFASTLLLLVFMAFSSFTVDNSSAQALIPQDEVDTLKTISTKLNADDYFKNVTRYSCIEETGMNTTVNGFFSNVTCECNTTVFHVVTIELIALNLTGVFPEEFGNLTKLREIDLTGNYINGTFPASLTKIPLVILSVVGNRISGSIPSAFGDLFNLEELIAEDNLLEGPLPDSLVNLKNLRRILLSANNITGTIPESYGNLKNLTDFRIDGNSLSGAIPEFISISTKVTNYVDFSYNNLPRTPNSNVDPEGPSAGTIVGIIVPCLAIVVLLSLLIHCCLKYAETEVQSAPETNAVNQRSGQERERQEGERPRTTSSMNIEWEVDTDSLGICC